MKKFPPFPDVPADEQTLWVVVLLELIEKLRETIQQQDEEIGRLKDEIAILKGEKVRPKLIAVIKWIEYIAFNKNFTFQVFSGTYINFHVFTPGITAISRAEWKRQQARSRHQPPAGKGPTTRYPSDRVRRSGARRWPSRFIRKSDVQ
ncbi:MAG: hypothetical protein U1F76_31885, partial [Candidatus Competibacteraceae bacterium]